MKTSVAGRNFLLCHHDGRIHYPFSKFLTTQFDNANTRELVSQSLRILARFSTSNGIELSLRALDGQCLSYDECVKLAALCFRPLGEIETLSEKNVRLIASAKTRKAPADLPKAVEPNTVRKRLGHIASYLKFYREVFLESHIRSSSLRAELAQSYERTQEWLSGAVSGTKQNHHLNIQSLPSGRFLAVIRAVYVQPQRLFLTESGEVSSTLYRDRAMTLLACEGLRPGSIGNIAREDFHAEGGYLNIKDHRRNRQGRPTTGTPALKLGQSTRVNSASETMITLYPFTVQAILDYIEHEREPILRKHLKNRSRGFLFLNQSGGPIEHRSTLTRMFNLLGHRLRDLGLLDVGKDPHFRNKKQYDFYSYVLRHSAASLFLEMSGTQDEVLDRMRKRFGWTIRSEMPQLYAARALSDRANVDLNAFSKSLFDEARVRGKS